MRERRNDQNFIEQVRCLFFFFSLSSSHTTTRHSLSCLYTSKQPVGSFNPKQATGKKKKYFLSHVRCACYSTQHILIAMAANKRCTSRLEWEMPSWLRLIGGGWMSDVTGWWRARKTWNKWKHIAPTMYDGGVKWRQTNHSYTSLWVKAIPQVNKQQTSNQTAERD